MYRAGFHKSIPSLQLEVTGTHSTCTQQLLGMFQKFSHLPPRRVAGQGPEQNGPNLDRRLTIAEHQSRVQHISSREKGWKTFSERFMMALRKMMSVVILLPWIWAGSAAGDEPAPCAPVAEKSIKIEGYISKKFKKQKRAIIAEGFWVPHSISYEG